MSCMENRSLDFSSGVPEVETNNEVTELECGWNRIKTKVKTFMNSFWLHCPFLIQKNVNKLTFHEDDQNI